MKKEGSIEIVLIVAIVFVGLVIAGVLVVFVLSEGNLEQGFEDLSGERFTEEEGSGEGETTDDFDTDGVHDDSDNCPFDFNPTQGDSDGDGIGDACDGVQGQETPPITRSSSGGGGGGGSGGGSSGGSSGGTCSQNEECSDGILCTIDSCSGGSCSNVPDSGLCPAKSQCLLDYTGCYPDICIQADFNGDMLVNGTDQIILNENFGPCPEPPAECPWDLNMDGNVTFQDLGIIAGLISSCKDADDDGYVEHIDNCPGEPNPDQSDGDDDGVGDICDNCPVDFNPGQEDVDGDGVGNVCDDYQNPAWPPEGLDNFTTQGLAWSDASESTQNIHSFPRITNPESSGSLANQLVNHPEGHRVAFDVVFPESIIENAEYYHGRCSNDIQIRCDAHDNFTDVCGVAGAWCATDRDGVCEDTGEPCYAHDTSRCGSNALCLTTGNDEGVCEDNGLVCTESDLGNCGVDSACVAKLHEDNCRYPNGSLTSYPCPFWSYGLQNTIPKVEAFWTSFKEDHGGHIDVIVQDNEDYWEWGNWFLFQQRSRCQENADCELSHCEAISGDARIQELIDSGFFTTVNPGQTFLETFCEHPSNNSEFWEMNGEWQSWIWSSVGTNLTQGTYDVVSAPDLFPDVKQSNYFNHYWFHEDVLSRMTGAARRYSYGEGSVSGNHQSGPAYGGIGNSVNSGPEYLVSDPYNALRYTINRIRMWWLARPDVPLHPWVADKPGSSRLSGSDYFQEMIFHVMLLLSPVDGFTPDSILVFNPCTGNPCSTNDREGQEELSEIFYEFDFFAGYTDRFSLVSNFTPWEGHFIYSAMRIGPDQKVARFTPKLSLGENVNEALVQLDEDGVVYRAGDETSYSVWVEIPGASVYYPLDPVSMLGHWLIQPLSAGDPAIVATCGNGVIESPWETCDDGLVADSGYCANNGFCSDNGAPCSHDNLRDCANRDTARCLIDTTGDTWSCTFDDISGCWGGTEHNWCAPKDGDGCSVLCEVTTQCNDGIDNDEDGVVDWPEDPACESAQDDSELGVYECSDSDGGIAYDLRGDLVITEDAVEIFSASDQCKSTFDLTEHSCPILIEFDNGNLVGFETEIDCAQQGFGSCFAGACNPNAPPVVDAGNDMTITWPDNELFLDGSVTDDGLPDGILDILWQPAGGVQVPVFDTPTQEDTRVTFPEPGSYSLELSGNDGMHTARDFIVIVVEEGPPLPQRSPPPESLVEAIVRALFGPHATTSASTGLTGNVVGVSQRSGVSALVTLIGFALFLGIIVVWMLIVRERLRERP